MHTLALTLLSTLLTLTNALTFTSPFPGSTVDLTAPLSVNWIPAPNDPSTFTLTLIPTQQGSSFPPQVLATGIQTSKGGYTVPAATINAYGDGFELLATDSAGDELGRTGAFGLQDGGSYSLSTSAGVLTLVGTPTQVSAPSSSAAGSASSAPSSTEASPSSSAAAQSSEMSTNTMSSVSGPSTSTPTSQTKSSSSTSGSGAAATSSGSSNSSGNLGFDSAAAMVRGSAWAPGAAVLGALAILVLT